jgi:phosphoribosyl-ATP pyrophosphohydrolase
LDQTPPQDLAFLLTLASIIQQRREHPLEESYTSSLFLEGTPRIAQKVGEEAVEVVVAALAQDKHALTNEIADLLYHLHVLMADQDIAWQDVIAVLRHRHEQKHPTQRASTP